MGKYGSLNLLYCNKMVIFSIYLFGENWQVWIEVYILVSL